mmetsp:Transcript_9697/g.24443  ORF Transcript_9697/g.24443 Transcript_9697/m.24443 type:complete len:200 (+) Transcript_9697:179-778(+)
MVCIACAAASCRCALSLKCRMLAAIACRALAAFARFCAAPPVSQMNSMALQASTCIGASPGKVFIAHTIASIAPCAAISCCTSAAFLSPPYARLRSALTPCSCTRICPVNLPIACSTAGRAFASSASCANESVKTCEFRLSEPKPMLVIAPQPAACMPALSECVLIASTAAASAPHSTASLLRWTLGRSPVPKQMFRNA